MSQPTDPQIIPQSLDDTAPPAPAWAQDGQVIAPDLPESSTADLAGLPPLPPVMPTVPAVMPAASSQTVDIPGISPPFDISIDPQEDTLSGLPPAPGLEDSVPPSYGSDQASEPQVPGLGGVDYSAPSSDLSGLPPAPGLEDSGVIPPAPSFAEQPSFTEQPTLSDPNLPPLPAVPVMDGSQDTGMGMPGSNASGDVPPPFTNDSVAPGSISADLSATSFEGKKSPIKMILIIILVLVLLVSGIVVAMNFFSGGGGLTNIGGSGSAQKTGEETNLTYWGLWELNNTMEEVIKEFEDANPGVKIVYKKQSHKDYRERLQSEIEAGTGPDIYRFHNSWMPMMIEQLEPAPSGTVSIDEYFPVIKDDVQVQDKIYGVPLMFDALALYYNPKMLQSASVSVPTTWEALRTTAQEIRVPADLESDIQQAGVAMGTVSNVEHFPDILGLLLLQNGADPAKPDECSATNNPKLGRPDCWGQDAFLFYDIFRSEQVWSDKLPSATYAFATEQVAMMFAPSWRAFEIKEINPELEFMTAPVPQLTDDKVAWATYWIEGVSNKSQNSDMAWKFLAYLSEDETLKKLYTAQANVRMFGELYPKTELAKELENDDVMGAFVQQAEYAQSWYMSSYTHDNGINDQIIKYYEDAMNSIGGGEKPNKALPTVTEGVNQVLTKYGVGD